MSSTTVTRPPDADVISEPPTTRRLRIRRAAMLLSLGVVVPYGLIAANVVTVIDGPADQVARDQLSFALPAAAAYLLGAGLLWRFDRRLFWVAGAILQLLVISMYLAVAPQRDPAFEVWGLSIRVLQFGLLAALTYLATRPAEPRRFRDGVGPHMRSGRSRRT